MRDPPIAKPVCQCLFMGEAGSVKPGLPILSHVTESNLKLDYKSKWSNCHYCYCLSHPTRLITNCTFATKTAPCTCIHIFCRIASFLQPDSKVNEISFKSASS